MPVDRGAGRTGGRSRAHPSRSRSTSSPTSARVGAGRRGAASSLLEEIERLAELAQGVAARGLDVGERHPRLLRLVVDEVQGHRRLDVDQRDVVGQHVVEVLGDREPPGLESRRLGLLGLTLASRGLVTSDADEFGCREDDAHPSGDEEQRAVPDPVRERIDEGGDDVPDVPDHGDRGDVTSPPGLDGEEEGDHGTQEHRSVRVPGTDVDRRRRRARRRRPTSATDGGTAARSARPGRGRGSRRRRRGDPNRARRRTSR